MLDKWLSYPDKDSQKYTGFSQNCNLDSLIKNKMKKKKKTNQQPTTHTLICIFIVGLETTFYLFLGWKQVIAIQYSKNILELAK